MKPQDRAKLPGRANGLFYFFKAIGNRITGLFQPEEVEVTFTGEGKKMSYTYTKVAHKQVA